MRILYVADRWDPKDHNQASGTDYEIYHAFLREGAEVDVIGPFENHFSLFERFLKGIHNRLYDTRLFKYPFSYFVNSTKVVNRAIEDSEHDLVVSKYSAPLVFAKLQKPLLYFCDSTVKWLEKQWRSYARLTFFTMSLWETKVITKSDHIITFSKSNADFLQDHYQVPKAQVDFMPIPASIPYEMVPREIEKDKNLKPVKLLLVGRDYERKGVDIAENISKGLNRQGVETKLRIVGLEGKDSENVRFMGLFNKTIPQELNAYLDQYRWAHFLIHPARFEAAGIVPAEAAAFGVPTITNNTGGLATTVENGVSGIILPKSSPAKRYVSTVREYIKEPSAYWRLVKSTKDRYEQDLHWHSAGKTIFRIAQDIVGKFS